MEPDIHKLLSHTFDKNIIIDNPAALHLFVLDFYRNNGRDLPWRKTVDPYRIFVSEMMLQQTQVSRVIEKYGLFIEVLPDFKALSRVSTSLLLELWNGLGYNRRALYLRDAARTVVETYGGGLPDKPDELVKLKGIGPNTSSSICAFAFNKPVVFIETNIRRFFIHFFFKGADQVNDGDILFLAGKTLYRESPRDWYNALMDFGSLIPKAVVNPNRKSTEYKKQGVFSGSFRQTRGEILRMLRRQKADVATLIETSPLLSDKKPEYIRKAADSLVKDGFVSESGGLYIVREN